MKVLIKTAILVCWILLSNEVSSQVPKDIRENKILSLIDTYEVYEAKMDKAIINAVDCGDLDSNYLGTRIFTFSKKVYYKQYFYRNGKQKGKNKTCLDVISIYGEDSLNKYDPEIYKYLISTDYTFKRFGNSVTTVYVYTLVDRQNNFIYHKLSKFDEELNGIGSYGEYLCK